MGIFKMRLSKRTLIIIVLVLIAGLGIAITLLSAKKTPAPTTTTTSASTEPSGLVDYTDAVTGEPGTDLPDKALEFTVQPPRAQIAGLDLLYNDSLTNAQANVVQSQLINFLLARGGISIAAGAIKDHKITHSDPSTLHFTLVGIKPQGTYDVTVVADPTANPAVTPQITFKEVE